MGLLTSVAYGVLALCVSAGTLTVWALMVAAGRAEAEAARMAVPVRRRTPRDHYRRYHRN